MTDDEIRQFIDEALNLPGRTSLREAIVTRWVLDRDQAISEAAEAASRSHNETR